jgi:rhodanese-related sulfurtransferase
MQGKSVKVEYTEENGVKSAIKIVEKPAAIISSDVMSPKTVMTTADLEKLVAVGSEKGKYTLIDSRPLHLFQEGAIPTSIDLPYDEFDKLIDRLPKDKNAMIVFYDSGPSCNMSPTSAAKAHKLGYTNIRIYKDGMPGWLGKNFGVLSVKDLKDAWIDKDIPLVLLDVRAASKEFIKGAVAFPAKKAAKSIKGLDIKKNAPIVVYDQKSGKDASKVAAALVKAEFTNVLVLHGGFDGWKQAKHAVAKGKLSVKATYVPKPRLGEVNFDDFKKYAVSLPADVMVIDVRNAADVKKGKLPTAINIPVGDLKKRMSEISKDKLVVTYCNSGAQAEMAYYALKDLGFTNVKFLKAKTTFEQDGSYSIIKD